MDPRGTKTNNVLEKFRDGGKASSCWLRSQRVNPMPPTQRATDRSLHILCIKLTHLKTRWNQLIKRSTVFSFQFILVRRNRSLMSCKNYSQGGLGIPDLKAEASAGQRQGCKGGSTPLPLKSRTCGVRRRVLFHKDMMASRTFPHLFSAKSARMSR